MGTLSISRLKNRRPNRGRRRHSQGPLRQKEKREG